MTFASNATYSSAPNPVDVGAANKVVPPDIPNGFKPEAPVAAEHINYCLSRLECVTETFVNNGTWTKPAGAVQVRFTLVGGGAGGASGASSTGGRGGANGEIIAADFPAFLLPASLSVVIGAGGAAGDNSGGATYVADGATTRAFALGGGGFSGPGTPPDITSDTVSSMQSSADGGAGGASSGGLAGKSSRFAGKAGTGGTAGNRGLTGFGYGAGGGGGRNSGGTSAGGGGGSGGYGLTQPAGAAGGTSSTGAAGAQGVCVITTWREIS